MSILSINFLTWLAVLFAAAASAYFLFHNLMPILRTTPIGAARAPLYSAIFASVHVIFLFTLKFVYL